VVDHGIDVRINFATRLREHGQTELADQQVALARKAIELALEENA
jgi:hypothetical protein